MTIGLKRVIQLALLLAICAACSSAAESSETETYTPSPNPRSTSSTPEKLPPPDPGNRIPLIFSHGGAPCDIGALVYFNKHPGVDLIGMVLSRGEIHPDIAINKWAAFLFEVLGHEHIPIGLGTDERMDPASHDFPDSWRAAGDNFWGLPVPEPYPEFEPLTGHELIVELVNASPHKVTIIAMASMVDVALALQQDPGIIENIEHVVIMGGAFTVPGNLADAPYYIDNDVAEWNMWIDARAAKYLVNSGVAVSMVPLDAIQYLVQPSDVQAIAAIQDTGVGYVAENWNSQVEANPAGFLIWDSIAAVAVTDPELFFWVDDGIDVVAEPGEFQGRTIALKNGAVDTRYATGADYQAIMDVLLDIFSDGTVARRPGEVVISGLGGVWEGFSGEFHITFTLGDECRLHEQCGTFEIPEFSMTGDITFVAIDGSRYEFKASNISSGIEGNEYEYLEMLSDGTLLYHTEGGGVTSEAVLYRK